MRKKVDMQREKIEDKAKASKEKLLLEKTKFDPTTSATADPEKYTTNKYSTLFVGKLNKTTTEETIRKLLEEYGEIVKICMVKNKEGVPRGYAFVEFKDEQDMTTAARRANGVKVDGQRVLVDVERGRTVKGWYPRRLGGGLGGNQGRSSGGRRGGERRGGERRDYDRRDSHGDRGGREYRERGHSDRDYRDRDRGHRDSYRRR